MPASSIEAFKSWRSARDTDAKAADARLMLSAFAAGDPAFRPAGPADKPIRNVHTRVFEQWHTDFHGASVGGQWVSDATIGNVIRLVHPRFRDAYRRHVLSRIAGLEPAHPALAEQAVAVAQARGLRVPAAGSDLRGSWLTAKDLALPPEEALATLLVRAFGVARGRTRSQWDLPAELKDTATVEWARCFAVSARVADEALLGVADGPRGRLKLAAVDQTIAELWRCDVAELEQQAWDRGIADLATLRLIAAPLVAQLRFGDSQSPPTPDEAVPGRI